MPSPIPGMDPFLEDPAVFPDLHDSLIVELRNGINAQLPPPYYASSASRVWVEPSQRRVGPDVGTQYRSAIFYHSPEQERVAWERIAELDRAGIWDRPIVTQVVPFEKFYPAEDYHQGYYRDHPGQPYCQAVISPKVAKFRKQYADKLKA